MAVTFFSPSSSPKYHNMVILYLVMADLMQLNLLCYFISKILDYVWHMMTCMPLKIICWLTLFAFQLVFSSSATVYGWPKEVPCTEDFPLSAANPYGRTKVSYLFLEIFIIQFKCLFWVDIISIVCSSLLKRYAVTCMPLTPLGRSFYLDILILWELILVDISVRILVEFLTTSCLIYSK